MMPAHPLPEVATGAADRGAADPGAGRDSGAEAGEQRCAGALRQIDPVDLHRADVGGAVGVLAHPAERAALDGEEDRDNARRHAMDRGGPAHGRSKPVFHGLGVFAMTKPFAAPAWSEPAWAHGAVRNHADLDADLPLMPYGKASRLGLLARLCVGRHGSLRASFLPMMINDRYQPEVLSPGEPRFDEVVGYVEWASQDMPHRFSVAGGEVVVS